MVERKVKTILEINNPQNNAQYQCLKQASLKIAENNAESKDFFHAGFEVFLIDPCSTKRFSQKQAKINLTKQKTDKEYCLRDFEGMN